MTESGPGGELSAAATPLPMIEADASTIACSLDTGELVERLDRIARIGERSWLGADSDGQRHTLRFRDDRETRTGLEAVIAAERECCQFLDLTLDERQGELILGIDAGSQAEPVAAAFAAAFQPQRSAQLTEP
jgi:hypothetical protein